MGRASESASSEAALKIVVPAMGRCKYREVCIAPNKWPMDALEGRRIIYRRNETYANPTSETTIIPRNRVSGQPHLLF